MGHCADFDALPEAINRGQYLVPKLTREQRKEAIVKPVELRGFKIAPRLVQRILNDVTSDFDDLPITQHVLTRTWRQWAEACRGTRPIDIEDYEATGAAADALSRHADEAFESLTGLATVVERVFRALTERTAEGVKLGARSISTTCATWSAATGRRSSKSSSAFAARIPHFWPRRNKHRSPPIR